MSAWIAATIVVGAYLIGAVPIGFILVKAVRGKDIRRFGSGNIGATNVGRHMGREWGLLVWLLDALKGFLPCAAAGFAARHVWPGYSAPPLVVVSALAVIVGNMFPVYLGFRGGKGVSTSCGVFLYLFPLGFAISAATWGVVLGIWRYVSLASILASIALVACALFLPQEPFGDAKYLTAICLLIAALVILRHASNIRRLIAGTENKIGKTRA